jgi:membrane protein DedA with SNARE-associated domain
MDFTSLLLSLSYFGILLAMTANGVMGFPSSQILYIAAGYFVSTGDLVLGLVLFAGTLGNTLGNIILYELAKVRGLKVLDYFPWFPKSEVKKVQILFKKKGIPFLFFGKLINPIKIIIPIPAGISHMNRILFSIIVAITSFIWAGIFLSLGILFGKSFALAWYYPLVFIVLTGAFLLVVKKAMNSDWVLKELEKEL